ncbi:Flp pilus assembly protein CpaB [Roseovarius sp. D0-M9]|uniref:Flp pilus assembly protein CpaB n=1 Tax=Roseovarius sp. D0-M9 TaxID=3127117 RepID=UPI00300FF5FE
MLRPLILIVALVAGGGAAWIAAQNTGPASDPVAETPAPAATERTAVLVAAQDVPRGDQVAAGAMKWLDWPADAVPATFIERTARPEALNQLSGRYAARPLAAGEPISEAALSMHPNGFLAATLAPGKRAVAINVNAQSTAGGFILPNDRVDVLHTVKASRESEGRTASSRTLLKGVRVLAIDQTTEDTESGTVLGKTATLELTERQVEVVTAAETTGTLSLSLRPLDATPAEASMEIEAPVRTIRVRRGTVIEDVEIN